MSESMQGTSGQQTPEDPVSKWIRSQPFLAQEKQAGFLRSAIGYLIMGLAAVLAVWFFLNWCRMVPDIKEMSFVEGVGFLMLLLGRLLGVLLALAIMFYRGWLIRSLSASGFIFGPILGTLAAMWGEMAFAFLAVMSLPAMVSVWCESRGMRLPLLWTPDGGDNRFLDGLSIFLACWVTGLAVLVVGRWVKEWLQIVVQIAQDVRVLRDK